MSGMEISVAPLRGPVAPGRGKRQNAAVEILSAAVLHSPQLYLYLIKTAYIEKFSRNKIIQYAKTRKYITSEPEKSLNNLAGSVVIQLM